MSAQCRSAGRRLASGSPAATALEEMAHALSGESMAWRTCAATLGGHGALVEALRAAAPHATADETTCLDMISAAVVDRWLSGTSLEHVAEVLDEIDGARHEIGVATSQAIHTVRLLTWLPAVVLAAGFVVSDSMRALFPTATVLVPVGIGTVLNLLGRAVVARGIARCTRLIEETPDSPARIAECLAASFSAGLSVVEACERLDSAVAGQRRSGTRREVADALRSGSPLTAALAPLSGRPDTADLADVIGAIARDGVSAVEATAHLARHGRTVRRTKVRAAAARLPVTLAVPVAVLFLPAFVIGAVVPVIAAGSVTFSSESSSPLPGG
ncbi:MAG: type II secretion system F family protein [Actinomycetota bacterium]